MPLHARAPLVRVRRAHPHRTCELRPADATGMQLLRYYTVQLHGPRSHMRVVGMTHNTNRQCRDHTRIHALAETDRGGLL